MNQTYQRFLRERERDMTLGLSLNPVLHAKLKTLNSAFHQWCKFEMGLIFGGIHA